MAKGRNKKRALMASMISLILCVSMLLGTTMAWFTDTVTNKGNRIDAGTLNVELLRYADDEGGYVDISNGAGDIFTTENQANTKEWPQNGTLWEPGKTQVVYLAVRNAGKLALNYNIILDVTNDEDNDVALEEVFTYAIVPGINRDEDTAYSDWATILSDAQKAGEDNTGEVWLGQVTAAPYGALEAEAIDYFALAVHMDEEAGNDYQGQAIEIDVKVVAKQMVYESDSFGNEYDASAWYDEKEVNVLFETDFEKETVGSKPSTGDKELYMWSAIDEKEDKYLYARCAEEDGNKIMHLYRSDGTSASSAIVKRKISISGLDNLTMEYKVKVNGDGSKSALSFIDSVDGKTIRKIYETTAAEWTNVKIEMNLAENTYIVYVNGKQTGEEAELNLSEGSKTMTFRFGAGSLQTGTGKGVYYDDIKIWTTGEAGSKILDGQQGVYWENVKPTNALSEVSLVNNLVAHPRVLVTDWNEIYQKITASGSYEIGKWYENLKKTADNALISNPPGFTQSNGRNQLVEAREGEERLTALSFVYNVEKLAGNPDANKYLEKAYSDMVAMGEWQDWSATKAYLVTAQIMFGYGCAYDWLYNDLTEEQRATIYDILQKQALVGLVYAYEGESFATDFTVTSGNWNPVCNSGAMAAALAFADEQPEIAEYILEKAPEIIVKSLSPYAPEGAYPEGATYWDLGTTHLTFAISMLDDAFEDDFKIYERYPQWEYVKYPGIEETTEFHIYYNGTTGRFNYGDSGLGLGACEVAYYYADKFNKSQYAWYENKLQRDINSYLSGYPAVAAICWYNPDNATVLPGSFKLDKFYQAEADVNGIIMRSTWEGDDAFYVGMQGGNNTGFHMHYSLGTYVIENHGVRFVENNNSSNYSLSGSKNIFYNKRSEAYNTLVINPSIEGEQNSPTIAQVIAKGSSDNTAYGILDMKNVYNAGDATVLSAKRGIMLTDNRNRVIVQDEVKLDKESEFYWFANTSASVRISSDGKNAILEKNGERMLARIIKGPESAVFTTMERISVIPSGVTNTVSGGIKLAIHVEGLSELDLAVEYVGLSQGEGIPEAWTYVPMENWTAQDNDKTTVTKAGSATVLMPGTPVAIANGQKTYVDADDHSVTPVSENSVVYVPGEFIEETFSGADVTVSGTSAVITYGGKTLSVTTNTNGLVPLTSELVALLGRVMSTDERGLVIIVEAGVSYDEDTVTDMWAEINVRVQADGKDLGFFNLDREYYALDFDEETTSPATISVIAPDGITASVTQATVIGTHGEDTAGDTAKVTITVNGNSSDYYIKMQKDPFEDAVSNTDDGVLYSLTAGVENQYPDEDNFIKVVALESSTGWDKYPEFGIVDGVIINSTSDVAHSWGSDAADCWIMMDFGEAKSLHSMAFAGVTQTSRAYNFDVQVSVNGTDWTEVHTGGAQKTDERMYIIEFDTNTYADALSNVRYVKMFGHGSTAGKWNKWAEVRFYESHEKEQTDKTYWGAYFASAIQGDAGENKQINLVGCDYAGTEVDLSTATVIYKIADESIATVSADGMLTFISKGTTTIEVSATLDGFTAKFECPIECR